MYSLWKSFVDNIIKFKNKVIRVQAICGFFATCRFFTALLQRLKFDLQINIYKIKIKSIRVMNIYQTNI